VTVVSAKFPGTARIVGDKLHGKGALTENLDFRFSVTDENDKTKTVIVHIGENGLPNGKISVENEK
jgi:hypothetical protein